MTFPGPRYDIHLPVELSFENDGGTFPAVSENLSATGMLVRSGRPRPPGTLVHFRCAEFAGTAHIIWSLDLRGTPHADISRYALMGMEFASLSGQDRDALFELLRDPFSSPDFTGQ